MIIYYGKQYEGILDSAIRSCFGRSRSICRGEHGKPEFADGKGSLSITHTVMGKVKLWMAVFSEFDTGIDAESFGRTVGKARDIAERYFTEAEAGYLAGLPEGEQSRGFIRLWTMKEAFLKKTGTGISGGLDSVELVRDGRLLSGAAGARFINIEIEEYPELCVTLAVDENEPGTLDASDIRVVRLEDLERAREAALTLLDHGDRTSAEMRDRLRKKGYSREIADTVTGALEDAGLIDDRRYAELFTESKLEAGRGTQWIRTKLMQKGIPSGLLGQVLEEARESLSEDVMCLRTALSLTGLQHRYYADEDGELTALDDDPEPVNYFSAGISGDETDRRIIYKEKEKAKSKLARKLISRGYSPGAAFSAVKKIDVL